MPRRAITLISTACSWVRILGGAKAPIFAQMGQFYFDAVGQYYCGANNKAALMDLLHRKWLARRRSAKRLRC